MKNCKYFKAKGIDYKGQLQKIQKSNNKLQPLYEALTNSIEAIKLLEDKNKEALEDECADILLYLLLIADKSKIDLINAATKKIAKNAQKYPIAQSFGSKAKYSALKKT